MSYCSHQLLDFDRTIGMYRCRDCPVHFEARAIHGAWKSEPKEKAPNRTLPIVAIGAGLIFAIAVLFMFFKLQNDPSNRFFGEKVCQESEKWEKMAQEANTELKACLERPPKIKIVEIPMETDIECPACPDFPQIDIPECPKLPEIPSCPQYDPPECEKCEENSRSYETEFSQCMQERGDALYRLGQCEEGRKAPIDCSRKVQDALEGSNDKIEELRGIISTLTLNQGGKCPRIDVSVPEQDCSDEITAACGELREALEFYFDKSKSQPGKEDADGHTTENTMTWGALKPGALFGGSDDADVDDDFKELDLESD